MEKLTSVNPWNNKSLGSYPVDSFKKVDQILKKAETQQQVWKDKTLKQRQSILKKFARALLQNKEYLAEVCTAEMGKPLSQSIAEVEKCARSILYYADQSSVFLQDQSIRTEAQKSYISYQPLGVVLAIMPWNFPYWQVCRALGPIMVSGNTMVLKHASNVTGCALALKKVWDGIDPERNNFQVIKVKGEDMPDIIAHPAVAAVTFTGSSLAGARVAEAAARHIKKQVLELGGSDPYIILKDADIDLAVRKCTQSRLNNAGQSCIAAKRFIVDQSVADEFTLQLRKAFEAKTLGDPTQAGIDLGPMARVDLRDELHQQVLKSKKKGARIILGGVVPPGDHALYPPTILTNVRKGMPAYDEEMFGPVASIIIAKDEEDAIRIANDSIYGLGGAVFSRNQKKAERIAAERIHSGFVAVNDFVSSDPRLPFGGVKQSGYGRELSHLGMHEFCNIKTIFVN